MQGVSINANKGSQAFGQDSGGAVLLGASVKATVVDKLENNIYLLQVGKQTLEAKVMAELDKGVEYQFSVEKGGQPPELSVLDKGVGPLDEFSPEEQAWLKRLSKSLGQNPQQMELKGLLSLARSLGAETQQPVVEATLKKLLPLIESILAIDEAPPAIRRLLGQTLAFTMHHNPYESGEGWLGKTVQLSGQLPNWTEAEGQFVQKLKGAIEALPEQQQQAIRGFLIGTTKIDGVNQENLSPKQIDIRELLMDSSKSPKATALLKQAISQLIEENEPISNPRQVEAKLNEILKDVNKRLFLSSSSVKDESVRELGSLQRKEGISAFQRQAPGLMTKDISNLLEQFTTLGGKLEKLPIGDVLSAQMSWKGSSPSAMQVHLTGSVLFLSQELEPNQRHFFGSDLITKAPSDQLPVVIDPTILSDPSSSSLSMKRMEEFSQQSRLPDNFHVRKLLQNWHQSGGDLAELRTNLSEIDTWNRFAESYPELRAVLAEHLMGSGLMVRTQVDQAPKPISVMAQTQQALSSSLQSNPLQHQHIPQKDIAAAMQALQEVAGEGQSPSKTQVAVASWLLGKGIQVTPKALESLLMFHSGHQEAKSLFSELKALQNFLKSEHPSLALAAEHSLAELQDKDVGSVKNTLSFYQKGNGAKVSQWLRDVRQQLSQSPQPKLEWLQLTQALQGKMSAQEDFLTGLKQYNIQAQRQDTPQLYEIPLSFGGEAQQALLKVFKRTQGEGAELKKNFKVVLELNLEGLGKVRSEISLHERHLQLDFLSPEPNALSNLKASASRLLERLGEHQLNASLAFKEKKLEKDLLITERESHATPKETSSINITA